MVSPEPIRLKRPYDAFLSDSVDLVHPRPRLASVYTSVTEWLESVGSDRKRHCRSDSHLHHSNKELVSRPLKRSVSEVGYTRDADGFVVPPTPASTGSCHGDSEDGYSGSSASSTAGVRNQGYRQSNLGLNHISIRHPDAPLPGVIAGHIDGTLHAERDSPELLSDEVKQALYQLNTLAEGCTEDQVVDFSNDIIFPNPKTDPTYGPAIGLTRSSGTPMSQHLVPINPVSPYRVSQPKPDKLYGYSGDAGRAFTEAQLLAQTMVHPRNPDYPSATAQGLRFPFFAIEFKAAGGTRGDLWVATNQCAGASAACLNAVHQLNTSLPQHPSVQRVDNLSYSIAMDNNTAQLYVSWKEDGLSYYLQRVDAFLLSNPEHFKAFRKRVRNILDWGKDTRLKQIRDALDVILEENRKKATERAKSRQPSSDGSVTVTVTSKKRKPSSMRRNSSKS